MNKKLFPLSATAIAAALALAGCASGSGAGSSGTSTPGTDQGSSSSSAPSTTAPASAAEHNAADVTFAQMMIPHHAQAVQMSETMLKKQDIPAEVTTLATKIKAAQGPEIDMMTGWLKGWNEPMTGPSGHSMNGMNGMMGDGDMKMLDAAQGTEAARLFLKQMIAHHEGAIMMAKTENTAGKNTDAVRLSKDIVSAQEAEIQEMQKLLAAL
ncbi:DUF305 domain-containing protein [Arthrobacter sp. KBS0703]|jgi:uncharacterized protein (DUF305 family)|uniref:DUF305 domain-containing protein n=1 Tax=Arthrobacter sp. KBS0703 TaxID=1955698 RepID=UPI00098EA697|nr:DUF305 domain-containing protein [Arthrobacter sp. KBS0703]TSE14666.1 DUF305 domain-containing protein [Arthrobacter sp. KBS0703]